jgi:hypothetical protein
MTVEDILKRRFASILLQETPYVLEEARFGMFDIAAYVPEDSVVEGLGESAKLSAVRACNRYQLDGTCSEKKRTFLRNFEPVYDEQCLLQGFRDNEKDILLSEKDFNMLIGSKNVVRHVIACDAGEDGKGCEYLDERLKWENGFLAGYGLKQGLHLFEFKSDHDNVNRFLEQLPHYAMFADYVWLVLGSEQKIPKWLPSYVGIYQESGEGFTKRKESEYVARTPPLSHSVLRESGLGDVDDDMLYDFMRTWFINSIFFRSNGIAIRMQGFEKLFRPRPENGKKGGRQRTLDDQ